MNIQLSGTEEFIDGKSTGSLGQVLIRYDITSLSFHSAPSRGFGTVKIANINSHGRCNNVLWISAAKGVEMNGAADVRMEG
jgi:small nuclear ribonucleoprotein F